MSMYVYCLSCGNSFELQKERYKQGIPHFLQNAEILLVRMYAQILFLQNRGSLAYL